jgi:hypothetical protein
MNVAPEPDIVGATTNYDAWLTAMKPAFRHDLEAKSADMARSPADFLRSTFYWWACRFPVLCPDLQDAPAVRAAGDVHVANFGTWISADARLRWGLNDFDEACVLPFTNDLVRLAASALVARTDLDPDTTASAILDGYTSCLQANDPGAADVADDDELAVAVAAARVPARAYYAKLRKSEKLNDAERGHLAPVVSRLRDITAGGELYRRVAGRGSLGRVRVFALRKRSGNALEAKRVLRSAWAWAARGGPGTPADGDDRNEDQRALLQDSRRHRDPLSWMETLGGHEWVLRRLTPERATIAFADGTAVSADLAGGLLRRMGAATAGIHLLSGDPAPLLSYLAARPAGWLTAAAAAMQAGTLTDFAAWQHHQG